MHRKEVLGQVTHFRAGRISASPCVSLSGRPIDVSRLSLPGLLRTRSRNRQRNPACDQHDTDGWRHTLTVSGLHHDVHISGFNFRSSQCGGTGTSRDVIPSTLGGKSLRATATEDNQADTGLTDYKLRTKATAQ